MARVEQIGRGLGRFILCIVIASPMAASAAERTPSRADVSVSLNNTPDGLKSTANGSVIINAPLCAVWSVLASCELAPKIIPNVKRCRMIERDPAQGRWEVRELSGGHPFLPQVRRSVVRTDYEPQRRIQFRAVDGDLKFMKGDWVLEAVDANTTRAIYRGQAISPVRAPKPLVKMVIRADTTKSLTALREQAQSATCDNALPTTPDTSELHAAK